MLYVFITEVSKQTHFFLLQQHFLVKNVVTKNFQPVLPEFPTDPLPSLPKLLSLFLWQLLETSTSYSSKTLGCNMEQSEGDVILLYKDLQ